MSWEEESLAETNSDLGGKRRHWLCHRLILSEFPSFCSCSSFNPMSVMSCHGPCVFASPLPALARGRPWVA